MPTRKIIKINEEKCNGCGMCIIDCAEGALEIVDGKAKIVRDAYCDGLGACIGSCPEGALEIIEREADEFDEEAAMEHVRRQKEDETKTEEKTAATEEPLACGCPSAMSMSLDNRSKEAPNVAQADTGGQTGSQLGHWPVKLQLLGPGAPYLRGAELLLLADCAAAAYPGLHSTLLPGRAVAMGCPKLDDLDAHIERLADIIKGSELKSLTVVHMEVPCCRGFVYAAEQAIEKAGIDLPLKTMKIGRHGDVLEVANVA